MSTNEQRNGLETDKRIARSIEARVTDSIAGLVPWLAPVPSAALVANATFVHLQWPAWVAVIAGIVIEGLGLTSTSTALMLWDWNARKPANEPRAPFWIGALMMAIYFVATIGLTVVLDVENRLTHVAPAIFPVLAVVATVNIALRSQHKHRLERVAEAEMERKAEEERRRLERKADRDAKRQRMTDRHVNDQAVDGLVDRLQAGRAAKKASIINAMLDAYRVNPNVGDTELGGMVGVTRQTVYNYRKELEAAGRVHANGNGVEVVA